jgi:putative cardiolipin synthase
VAQFKRILMLCIIQHRHIRGARSLAALFAAVICTVITGCTPVPLNVAKPITMAETPAKPNALQNVARNNNQGLALSQSSIYLLNDGNEALGARLRLIEKAEGTLDLQYFLMKPDLSGALVSQALLAAADRGVRVRFLLDDVFTTVRDEGLSFLNAHPNISIRIFNPSMRPGPKAVGFITEFSRINRRMHNKSFTADSAFAIVGGRNIADEYFQINTTSEFVDFEVLVAGPAVAAISNSFDVFWNDGWSIPMERLRKVPTKTQLAEARKDLSARLNPARRTYDRAVNDPYFNRINTGQESMFTGNAVAVSDRPDKLKVPVRKGERILAKALFERIKNAQYDVILLTPYFVPEDYGARLFSDLAKRGVRVRIVTNSLGSTNHAYVHAGYRRHRLPLLNAGVELYEIRSDSLQVLGLVSPEDKTSVVMHTKLAVIDGRQIYVGSLNLDPRSIKQNSEFGLFIDSRPLAIQLQNTLNQGLRNYTYRLSQTPKGALIWNYDTADTVSITTKEPGATIWKKFLVGLTELLGVELQL